MKKLPFVVFLFPLLLTVQDKRALTVEDLWAMRRIDSFDLSSDAKTIVLAVTSYSIEENKGNSDIYLINSDGGNLRSLKNSPKSELSPFFVPNSDKISYLLDGQIWLCNHDGSGEEKLTDVYTKIIEYKWSRSGDEKQQS